jgi:hypothetical protein
MMADIWGVVAVIARVASITPFESASARATAAAEGSLTSPTKSARHRSVSARSS